MRGNLAGPFDSSDPPKRLAQNLGFVFELRVVWNVLVIAAAANSEMRTSRGCPLRRRLEQALHTRANEFLLLLDGRRGNSLCREHEGHEDGRAVVMRQALAAVNQFFDGDFHAILTP